MQNTIGLFTGTFDPVTRGHVDLIERSQRLFSKLYVGIFCNREKAAIFRLEDRKRMIEEAISHLENVEVLIYRQELAATVAKQLGVTSFVRGIRNSQDFRYERDLYFFNHDLASEIETVFLLSNPNYQSISSSHVRELLTFKQNISPYVPNSVIHELRKRQTKQYETGSKKI